MSQGSFYEPQAGGSGDEVWQRRWYRIIFGYDTRAGKTFDVILIALILLSVLITLLDSVEQLHAQYGALFYMVEWALTLLFTLEYVVRLAIVAKPLRYARSFYGVIDLLAILPTWLSLLLPGSQYLLVVRVLRLLRIFRVLKLVRYVDEAGVLMAALRRSQRKIFVFLFAILLIVTVFGALMYLVEGPANGFTSIPMSMYWAIVTVGTVGFGDIAPVTALGRALSSVLILIGYGLIAVPTGIYTAELTQTLRGNRWRIRCNGCGLARHENDARHCRRCGTTLKP